MANELSEILKAIVVAVQEQSRGLDRLIGLAENLAKRPTEPAAPVPTDDEQRILDLLEDGSVLTGAQIARLLDDSEDNGTLRNRLALLVKKGFLVNRRPGYSLPRCD